MAAPYPPSNIGPFTQPESPAYVPPTGSEPTEFGSVGRPNPVVRDDLRSTTIANCIDGINSAWNGWEMAVKFEDDALQCYYMKYITLLNSTLEKARKI